MDRQQACWDNFECTMGISERIAEQSDYNEQDVELDG